MCSVCVCVSHRGCKLISLIMPSYDITPGNNVQSCAVCVCCRCKKISLIILSYHTRQRSLITHYSSQLTFRSRNICLAMWEHVTCTEAYDSHLNSTIMSSDPFPDKARMLEKNRRKSLIQLSTKARAISMVS